MTTTTLLTVPNRDLFNQGITRSGQPSGVIGSTLPGLRNYLARIDEKQCKHDYNETPLRHTHVSFADGHMLFQIFDRRARGLGEPMLVSRTAASQLANIVLPPRMHSGMRHLAKQNPTDRRGGEKQATMTWAHLNQTNPACETPMLLRTSLARVDGKTVRVLRAVVSQSYARYSHVQYLDDIIRHAPEYASLEVVNARLTDNALRFRLVEGGRSVELNTPVPMVEGFNSETGQWSIELRGGTFRLVCTNGMGSWDTRGHWRRRHTGDMSRIRESVAGGIESVLTATSGVVEAYQAALEVQIDNAYDYLQAHLSGASVAQRVIDRAQAALTHETTTPGGRLASCVDAITLVAQDESLETQYDLEDLAATILRNGNRVAVENGGRLYAPEVAQA